MPFILIVVGVVLLITAINGTTFQLAGQLRQDIFGPKGFMLWFVAIMLVGAVGYIKTLKGLSDSFIILMLLVLVVSNRGVFARFNEAVREISMQSQKVPTSSAPASATTNPTVGNVPGYM